MMYHRFVLRDYEQYYHDFFLRYGCRLVVIVGMSDATSLLLNNLCEGDDALLELFAKR